MSLLKRTLAVVLSFSLVLASLPPQATAQSTPTPGGPAASGPAVVFTPAEFVDFASRELAQELPGPEADLALANLLIQAGPLLRSAQIAVARDGAGIRLSARTADGAKKDVSVSFASLVAPSREASELARKVADVRQGRAEADEALDGIFDFAVSRSARSPEPAPSVSAGSSAEESPWHRRPRADSRPAPVEVAAGPEPEPAPQSEFPEGTAAQARASRWLGLNGAALTALTVVSAVGSVVLWAGLGLPVAAAVALPVAVGAAGLGIAVASSRLSDKPFFGSKLLSSTAGMAGLAFATGLAPFVPAARSMMRNELLADIRASGGKPLGRADIALEIERLARDAGIPAPSVFVSPNTHSNALAQAKALLGPGPGLLVLSERVLDHPNRAAILAHEVQHLRDFRYGWPRSLLAGYALMSFVAAAVYSAGAAFVGLALTVIDAVAVAFGSAPVFPDASILPHVVSALGAAAGAALPWTATTHLMELRADLGSAALTGDAESIVAARSRTKSPFGRWWLSALASKLKNKGGLWSKLGLGFGEEKETSSGRGYESYLREARRRGIVQNAEAVFKKRIARQALEEIESGAGPSKRARTTSVSFVLDVSGSMGPAGTQDFSSPLDQALLRMIAWMEASRVHRADFELVLASEKARVAVPSGKRVDAAALDAAALDAAVEAAQVSSGGESSIVSAYDLASKRLLSRKADRRILVLATDGDDTSGLDPAPLAAEAARKGVETFTIPAGADSTAFRETGFFGRIGRAALAALGLSMAAAKPTAAAPKLDDKTPEYYKQASPDWVGRLQADPADFATPKDAEKHARELERLRPVARWMAHVYTRLKEDGIQRAPDIRTIQDIVNWSAWVKKFEAKKGWFLVKEYEIDQPDRDGKKRKTKVPGAVQEAARRIFKNALPADRYEGRELQQEFEALLRDLEPLLQKLGLPEHLDPIAKDAAARPAKDSKKDDAEAEAVEVIETKDEEQPTLFKAEEIEALGAPDMIMTKMVEDRLEDLLMLYSTKHEEKFWPLVIGPTAEGKSAIVKHIFAMPEMRQALGRAVPVVSIPFKEAMTKRELFGGLTSEGVEFGFFTLAVKNGWVLVGEELDQASGEFKKGLNKALHQIRKLGYFEFELAGRTYRVKAHPHFWFVGTENGTEGNYAYSRNPDAPDFVKRFVSRYFDRIPPAEQAEIMHGLAAKWYGEAFLKRHGLSLNWFEGLMTKFHQDVRKLVDAGKLGGDFQEPYEFNRRTLHRFLKRWLHDLHAYEDQGKKLDERARHLLLARELMEAYATEVRLEHEREALWDKMNSAFKLQSDYKIKYKPTEKELADGYSDIRIQVTGIYRKGDKLIVEEALVPLELAARKDGGSRVAGPEHRLTLVPSTAESVYRSLRNRQFHEHEFSTGPTGAAKTSKQFFISHLLGEPLLDINMDEQTATREFHGGFVKNPKTGQFEFLPGIVARAMMFDPKGLLKKGKDGKGGLKPTDVRKSPHIGATLLVDEANASTIVETMNPPLDDGVLNLSDGRHTAVAGLGFHAVFAMNPVGEGYAGFPLTEALRSRGQTVYHHGDLTEEELTEIILDQLTGVVRHQLR